METLELDIFYNSAPLANPIMFKLMLKPGLINAQFYFLLYFCCYCYFSLMYRIYYTILYNSYMPYSKSVVKCE